MRLFVSYSGPASVESVTLTATCTPPLFLTTDAVTLPSLVGLGLGLGPALALALVALTLALTVAPTLAR